ncbi:MAG: type II 3-dehydroquinate dehydratase [Bacteriovoracaceae bacterium]|jgi:3-dehydroquinate dehydratase-2|nr:3-dehydroquinate dehydratase [Halobacteriovoraceae bacterium]MDP7321309.1 type II 3-dehydroquinate dehydratase [Bacteriovoracaceae bacterium]|tara:strand:+ start:261 stop:698 length:438 start_codon:yes stop_codon:yes gene_type:complete
MKKIIIINGPNLNLLGQREPETYGQLSLDEIKEYTEKKLPKNLVQLDWWQSNSETEIIEKIHEIFSKKIYDALIINPAAYSHTSVAILDALKLLSIPVVEVHLTNVYRRESFRHSLLTAQASSIIMSGLGKDAYYYAILTQLNGN